MTVISAEEWKESYFRLAEELRRVNLELNDALKDRDAADEFSGETHSKYIALLEKWEKSQENKTSVEPLEERVSRLEKAVASKMESLNAAFDARQNEINDQFAREDAKRAAQQAFNAELVNGGKRVSVRRDDLYKLIWWGDEKWVPEFDWLKRLKDVLKHA